jgi:hypothetical protein
MAIAPPPESTAVSFELSINLPGGGNAIYHETGIQRTVHNQNIGNIALGAFTLNYIELSGTLGGVTVNGTTPQSVEVDAYTSDGSYLGYGRVDPSSGNWSMYINPLSVSTEVQFRVYTYDSTSGSYSFETGITRTVHNTSIHNIALGQFNKTLITLSGTVDVTVNGVRPESMEVQAYTSGQYGNYLGYGSIDSSGNWNIYIEPLSASTEVQFRVEIWDYNIGSSHQIETGVSRMVYTASISNINLGQFQKNVVTLAGNVTLQKDGSSVENASVAAFAESGGKKIFLGSGYVNDSNWSIGVGAWSGTVSFRAMVYPSDGYILITDVDASKNIALSGASKTGINLGTVNIQTKNITVSVTQGGTPVDAAFGILRETATRADMMSDSIMYEKLIAGKLFLSSSSQTLAIPASTPNNVWLGVGIGDVSNGGGEFYITRSAVNISSGTISLDVNQMDALE